jgi:hypothetical protein
MCLLGGGSMTRRVKNNALLNQSHNTRSDPCSQSF